MFLGFGCLRGNVGWLGVLGWGRDEGEGGGGRREEGGGSGDD